MQTKCHFFVQEVKKSMLVVKMTSFPRNECLFQTSVLCRLLTWNSLHDPRQDMKLTESFLVVRIRLTDWANRCLLISTSGAAKDKNEAQTFVKAPLFLSQRNEKIYWTLDFHCCVSKSFCWFVFLLIQISL